MRIGGVLVQYATREAHRSVNRQSTSHSSKLIETRDNERHRTERCFGHVPRRRTNRRSGQTCEPQCGQRRDIRHRRILRSRKIHTGTHHQPAGTPDRRPGAHRRQRHHRAYRRTVTRTAQEHRVHLPRLQPDHQRHCRQEHRIRAQSRRLSESAVERAHP